MPPAIPHILEKEENTTCSALLEHYGTPGVHAQTQGTEKRLTSMTATRLPEIALSMVIVNPYCEAEMMKNSENRAGLYTQIFICD